MRLEVVPPVSPAELVALEQALVRAELEIYAKPDRTLTRWSRTAALEAVDARVSTPARYARSPLSTPGATRA